MNTPRMPAKIALVVLLACLAGCGNTVPGTPAPQQQSFAPTRTAAPDPAADQEEIQAVFTDFYEALRARDFAKACEFNAPETTQQLLMNLRARGMAVDSCADAYTTVYASPGHAEVVDGITRTATVQNVTVNGDNADLTWSAEVKGAKRTVTSKLRRIEGQWRLVDTGA